MNDGFGNAMGPLWDHQIAMGHFCAVFFDSLTLGKGKTQLLAREQKRNYDYDELTWDLSILGIGL